MRILGIDPGYAILGYGIIEKKGNNFRPVAYGALTTDAGTPMPDRLKYLYNSLIDIIAKYKPNEASVKKLFFNTNAKTSKIGRASCRERV